MKSMLVSVIMFGLISSMTGCGKQSATATQSTMATAEPEPAPPAKSPEPIIDQARQDELDWNASTLNPPWEQYDIIEHNDIKGEEHRFLIKDVFDKAKLKRYAEEYAVKHGSNLAAIEVRFYDKVNRSKIFDQRSNHLIACCEKEDDDEPVYTYLPDESNEGSLLFWRQTHFDSLKSIEEIKILKTEIEKKIKEEDQQRDKERAELRARLVGKYKELKGRAEQITEKSKKQVAEIRKLEELITKVKKANNIAAVQKLQSKIKAIHDDGLDIDLERLKGLKEDILLYANEINRHDKLTEKIRKDAEAKQQ